MKATSCAVRLSVFFVLVCLVAAPGRATETPQLRGASLNHPLQGWGANAWPWTDLGTGSTAEVGSYLDSLSALGFNSVRVLLHWQADWEQPRREQALRTFVDLAGARNLKVVFWVGFENPSNRGLLTKEQDPAAYQDVLSAARLMADRTIGNIAGSHPQSPVVSLLSKITRLNGGAPHE